MKRNPWITPYPPTIFTFIVGGTQTSCFIREITRKVTWVPLPFYIAENTYNLSAYRLPEQHTNPKWDKVKTSMLVPVSWLVGRIKFRTLWQYLYKAAKIIVLNLHIIRQKHSWERIMIQWKSLIASRADFQPLKRLSAKVPDPVWSYTMDTYYCKTSNMTWFFCC